MAARTWSPVDLVSLVPAGARRSFVGADPPRGARVVGTFRASSGLAIGPVLAGSPLPWWIRPPRADPAGLTPLAVGPLPTEAVDPGAASSLRKRIGIFMTHTEVRGRARGKPWRIALRSTS
jgi:hypothetical protein